VAIFRMNFTKSMAAAKAHIRYIQHRPGRRLAEQAHAHGGHSADYCCGLFDKYSVELGLPIERFNPADYIFHSRYCKIFDPLYWSGWYAPIRGNAPHNDKILQTTTASNDSTGGTAKMNGQERITRTLFGIDGEMRRHEAYRLIDAAEAGSSYFRIKISPDPKTEDTKRDLSLREVTETAMQTFEERIGKPVQWVAAEHDDHTPIRHVHVLAVAKGRLKKEDLQAIRQTATGACLTQRREIDQTQEQEREQEGAVWEQSV
jgi:hypothetical protein